MLRQRAQALAGIRDFFHQRGVLEVETPLLSRYSVTDPYLDVFSATWLPGRPGSAKQLYLQTSPEFAMKRLLASGSGPIFQICKAFRNEEKGAIHNPEFSLLEWYRPALTLDDIVNETLELILHLWVLLNPAASGKPPPPSDNIPWTSYLEAFLQQTGLHPLDAPLDDMMALAAGTGLVDAPHLCGQERALWLELLFSQLVQPAMKSKALQVIYDFPAILPSLAKPCPQDPRWVRRAEIYAYGTELANGFDELTDASLQAERFSRDQAYRQRHDLPPAAADDRLIAALDAGIPQCAGMAMGLDRLLMLLSGCGRIEQTLSFSIDRA